MSDIQRILDLIKNYHHHSDLFRSDERLNKKIFEENGVQYENILLGRMDVRGCIACETCRKNNKCVFDDVVNELAKKFEEADGH